MAWWEDRRCSREERDDDKMKPYLRRDEDLSIHDKSSRLRVFTQVTKEKMHGHRLHVFCARL